MNAVRFFFAVTLLLAATPALAITVQVQDQNGAAIVGSTIFVNGATYQNGNDVTLANGTYNVVVMPGFGTAGSSGSGMLARTQSVTIPGGNLTFSWTVRSVLLDVRAVAADVSTRIAESQVRIYNAPFAASDNVNGIGSVFSSQAYAYGPGLAVPRTLNLPVTTGYSLMSGNFADNGYDVAISPGFAGKGIGSLSRSEGVVGTPAAHVDASTSALIFEWKTRSVTLDVRTDAANPATRIPASEARIIGAAFATRDNVDGIPSVFSSQAYYYGPGIVAPVTVTLPVTTGYPALGGAYADNGYDMVVYPGFQGKGLGSLGRTEGIPSTPARHVTDTTTELVFEWKTRSVLIDVRSDAADPATRLVGSQARILGAAFATRDNVDGVPNLFSSQAYPYGLGQTVPFTVTLPVTSGYPAIAGNYADRGYDFSVHPGFNNGGIGPLQRLEGIPNTPMRHVEFDTTELVFEWKVRDVLVDVRADAADATTSLAKSEVRILNAGASSVADNSGGVPTPFSYVHYAYGPGVTVPFHVKLPVTVGYAAMAGAWFDYGYDLLVQPGFQGKGTGPLRRYEGYLNTPTAIVDGTTSELILEWKTRDVAIDIRSDAADPATSIPTSQARILNAGTFASLDNATNVPNVFSYIHYAYGPGPEVPFHATLPITTGYAAMEGSYADAGYDFLVQPGFDGKGLGPLRRYEGITNTPAQHVTATTSAIVFEWKTRSVVIDVRSDAADASTSIPASQVRILNAGAFPSADNGANVPNLYSTLHYDVGPGPTLPYTATLAVSTGYPAMEGAYMDNGYDVHIRPGLCGKKQGAPGVPSPANLEKYEGQAQQPPRHVDATTSSWIFPWALTSDGVPIGADYANLLATNVCEVPPKLVSPGDKTVAQGSTLAFRLSASDANPTNTLTFSIVDRPPLSVLGGPSLNATTGDFSWTPNYDQEGKFDVIFRVTDGRFIATAPVTITVTRTNRPPAFVTIGGLSVTDGETLDFAAREGQPLSLTAIAVDPNGTSPVYTVLTSDGTAPPAGLAIDAASGKLTWTPTFIQGGVYTLELRARDDANMLDTALVRITVADDNRPPSGPSLALDVDEGQLLTFTPTATDPDPGTTIVWTLTQPPPASASGAATFNPTTRVFSWQPDFTQEGTHTVLFGLSDGELSGTVTAVITVRHVNRPPRFSSIGNVPASDPGPLEFSVNEGVKLSLLAQATDPDGASPAFSATLDDGSPLPTAASIDTATGLLEWTPTFDQAGDYLVRVTARDPENASDSRMLTLHVRDVNRRPVLAPVPAQTVAAGTRLQFTATATDPDTGAVLRFSIGTPPPLSTFGVATIDATTGAFAWSPDFDQAGTYTVALVVSDGSLTASTPVTITVTAVNRPPKIVSVAGKPTDGVTSLSFTIAEGQKLSLAVVATDPDGGAPTFAAKRVDGTDLPAGMVIDAATGLLEWTPDYAQAGLSYVRISATDADGAAATFDVQIEVLDTNRPPVFPPIADQTVLEGVKLRIVATATDPDPGTTLTYTLVAGPSGAVIDAATGVFSWTPTLTQAGTYEVTLRVTDGDLPATVTFKVTVQDDLDPKLNSDADCLTDVVEAALHTDPTLADTDGDGYDDCAEQPGGQPIDTDKDGTIDALDSDSDGDGKPDVKDNCRIVQNTDQADLDEDGIGDVCDDDIDGDGLKNVDEDRLTTDPRSRDTDGDDIADGEEVGDLAAPRNTDADVPAVLDALDADSDGDTIADAHEAGDSDLATKAVDTDGDALPDYRDLDTDADGVTDADEAGDTDLLTIPVDTDLDGIADFRDPDSDGDGVPDKTDNCRVVVNADQADVDSDGFGDVCDKPADYLRTGGGVATGCDCSNGGYTGAAWVLFGLIGVARKGRRRTA